MEFSIQQDMTKFNQVMTDLAIAAGATGVGSNGASGRQFVMRQAGLLNRTLITITPPRDRAKTAKQITDNITGKFNAIGNPEREFTIPQDSKHGTGDVHWYNWDQHTLRGVARDADLTKASVEELYNLIHKIRPRGTISAGQRGKQRVIIWQKTTTKAATVKKLIARMLKHIGRLKAGWLVSYDFLSANGAIADRSRVPEWVQRHRTNARGYYIDGLGIPNGPTFTIANYAVGVKKAGQLFHNALEIRVKAMAKDMQLYIRGVKQKHGV